MKTLLLVVALVLVFLLCPIRGFQETRNDFFFKGWEAYKIQESQISGTPVVIVLVKNPDPNGKVKAVKFVATLDGYVLAYCFFEEEAMHYNLTDEGYKRNAKTEETCVKCHIPV